MPARWLEIQARIDGKRLNEHEAEQSVIGTTHGILGAYLLTLSGLPDVVEAVAFHNSPRRSPHRALCALTAVHVTNALDRDPRLVDTAYLEAARLAERRPS